MAAILTFEVLGIAVAAFVAGYASGSLSKPAEEGDAVSEYLEQRRKQLQERYATTEMDYVEFGDRIAVLEDPGTERIMRDAVDVDRIGPKTALEIARVFDGSYGAYRNADQSDYESVNGIGENKGGALAARTS